MVVSWMSPNLINRVKTYLWSGWHLDQEVRNNIPRTFAYGNYIDDVIAMKNAGSVSYFHRSYNQTTEAVTDASGNLVERYIETSPYGGYRIEAANGNALTESNIGNRSVFQGAPMTDPMSELVYLRNRWYSPEMGRWISRDPAGQLVNPGMNLYQAFNSKPEFLKDPMGLEAGKCCIDQPLQVSMRGKTPTGISMYFHASFKTDKSVLRLETKCEYRKNDVVVSIQLNNVGNAQDSVRYMSCSFADNIHAKGDTNRMTIFEPYLCSRNAPVSILLANGHQILLGRLVTKRHGYCEMLASEHICLRLLDGRDVCN